jgi:hypothetical protein
MSKAVNDKSTLEKSNVNSRPGIAWHYTTGQNFVKIVESNFLMPATTGVGYPEKPILWFSLDQYWEPTASKAVFKNGKIETLTMEETLKLGSGLVRFGMPVKKLHQWDKLKKKARINPVIAQGLEASGFKQGANPRRWYGVTKPLSISECSIIEVMDVDSKEWVTVRFNGVSQEAA